MAYKWTPPPCYAELILPDGKSYAPGDSVPISKEAALQMMRSTDHAFEGLDAPDAPTPTEAARPSK